MSREASSETAAPVQPTSGPRRPHHPVTVDGLLESLGILATGFTILGFLGKWWWAFDLVAHFRVQYFIVLALLAVVLSVRRRFRPALVVLAGMLINGAVLLPAFVAEAPRPTEGGLSLLLMNVNTANEQYDRAVEYVR